MFLVNLVSRDFTDHHFYFIPSLMNICEIANTLMVDALFLADNNKEVNRSTKPEELETADDFHMNHSGSLSEEEDPVVVDPSVLDDFEADGANDEEQLRYYQPELVHFPPSQYDDNFDCGKMAVKKAACASCYQDPQFANSPRRVKSLCELCRQAVCGEHVVKSCMVCHETKDGGGGVDLLALRGGLLHKKSNCSACLIDPTLWGKPKRSRTMCSLCKRPVCGTHLVKSCVACRLQFQEENEVGNAGNVELSPSAVQQLNSLKRKLESGD